MIRTLASLALGLPRGRFDVARDSAWIAMDDGVRLHHVHLAPVAAPDEARPCVLVRTPYDASLGPMLEIGRWLAAHGMHVVVQDVRGRYASEGRFVPFEAEGHDGGATLDWIAAQDWCDAERIAVAGPSYLGITAFAAAAARPGRVRAIAPIFASRDLWDNFYGAGGIFSLANSLEWASWIGGKSTLDDARIDAERGLGHLPLREADRVASRETPWYREWVDHPRRGAYWDRLSAPPLEASGGPLPSVLLVSGWYDLFHHPSMRSFDSLAAAGARIRLVVGPWSHGKTAHRRYRARDTWVLGEILRELLRFLSQELEHGAQVGDGGDVRVRYYDLGSRVWKRARRWPPRDRELTRFLAPGGSLSASKASGEGTSVALRSDPHDPIPSLGGVRFGVAGGAVDQRPVEARDDVASFTGASSSSRLAIAGRVCARVHVRTASPDLDLHLRLVQVLGDGTALNLCEGAARARWRGCDPRDDEPRWLEPGVTTPIDVDLGTIACTLQPGERLRLDLAGSSFPRFPRSPGSRADETTGREEDLHPVDFEIVSSDAHPSWVRFGVASP